MITKKTNENIENTNKGSTESIVNETNYAFNENIWIYQLFAEFLINLSNMNFNQANEKLIKIMELSSGNTLIMNNIGLTNFYLTKIDKSQSDFIRLIDRNEMNLFNEASYYNYNTILNVITPIPVKK